ncbi:MAG: BTAD domain-containing putative transcriptional regulator [Actinomycetota bacterium]
MLHLRLLGPLAVTDDDGTDLTPPGAREQAGLVTLAVVSPDPLSTERIAEELYGERETADPRNAVQAVVSRLRRALGRSAGSVETTTTGYRLVDVTLDVDDAERLLTEAIRAAGTGDRDAATTALAEAVAQWRGPTLDGLDGALIASERLRLDNLRADAEDAVLELRAETGGDGALITDLEAAVRDHPLRERRWELLMLTLYREGRQADALRAFQRARSLLSSHLGLDPGPGLAELEQRILAHDPGLATPTAPLGATATALDPTEPTADPDDRAEPVADGAALPRGTVSVLLCDVEGSVRRWESAPEGTARGIADLHRIWTEATEAAGGSVVKSTGDGILAVFATATDAIDAATAATRAQQDLPFLVKVAINTGTLTPVDADYRGPVVNRCARLLDLANGGQILVTGSTAELARADIPTRSGSSEHPEGLSLRDLGTHWLRDVPEPIAVWQVDGPGIRSGFPRLRSHGPRSLPRLRSELLGRRDLVERIVDGVGSQSLVTLLGPGGIGKTSLALAVGWELTGSRAVSFVDLARG